MPERDLNVYLAELRLLTSAAGWATMPTLTTWRDPECGHVVMFQMDYLVPSPDDQRTLIRRHVAYFHWEYLDFPKPAEVAAQLLKVATDSGGDWYKDVALAPEVTDSATLELAHA